MPAQAWFTADDVTVVPGAPTSITLRVDNVGDRTENYTIIPAGLTAPWITVTRPNLTLFGGSHDLVEVIIRPPAIHSTTAGPTPVAVRVVSQSDPESAVLAELVADVSRFDDRRITTLQPVRRARRRTTFEFMVENHGNSLANCRLHLVDPSNRIDGSFDPPSVGVAPGSSGLVRLNAKAQGSWLRRHERQLDFEIEATEPSHEPATGLATLMQSPTISPTAVGRFVAVAVTVLAIIVAWYGVLRPELRNAAERAVDDRLGTVSTAPPTTFPDVSGTVPPNDDRAGGVAATAIGGDPVDFRISVDVGVTQERSNLVTIPPDSEFLLTDLVLQNPNGDQGTAQLLRNGELLYEFDLGSMVSANEFLPRVTPLPFGPSDTIVLSVACDVVGQTVGTGCNISVLLTGLMQPASHDDT